MFQAYVWSLFFSNYKEEEDDLDNFLTMILQVCQHRHIAHYSKFNT
jgi:hypothetical protein